MFQLYGQPFVSLKAGWMHLYYTPPSQESAMKGSVCIQPEEGHSHHNGHFFPDYVLLNEYYLTEAAYIFLRISVKQLLKAMRAQDCTLYVECCSTSAVFVCYLS